MLSQESKKLFLPKFQYIWSTKTLNIFCFLILLTQKPHLLAMQWIRQIRHSNVSSHINSKSFSLKCCSYFIWSSNIKFVFFLFGVACVTSLLEKKNNTDNVCFGYLFFFYSFYYATTTKYIITLILKLN